ncbi:NTP transferase domain-containing protein [archaeon]|jgi:UDP-N-acetylglucosamine diphosphorylase / glucose-1-phosphate thymidylyltransferase / UDP-N-acetylgalactosamine diphosphorylase / glucosamine-1-phosphate N-acetyltransferase / galactosamine-1-phosphate N-acetyltransferase|nr:NTP transferase domain-containing protein [archaeon]MBT4023041.1 NTP transferase domain-containing protein [archaeon]MBT4272440.1 NTP transferase domain-containing protein [archaeon]MBT4460538.1 NTP transferase domain-containing protein [archaeon]MBT4857872.1 NTP transferase domain-containing protein [archaeon]
MQAVIFAAGKSTRTYPLTLTKPKPLLEILGKSVLKHNLEQLDGIVNEVIIIVGYKKEQIIEKFGNSFMSLKLRYIEQKELNGTGGALICAKEFLKNKFIVMNGDDYFSKKDIERCFKHEFCVLGKKVNELHRFGELVIKDNNIIEIKEKPQKKKGIANIGLYIFNDKIFELHLKKSPRKEYEVTDYIKLLSNLGKKVNYELVEDYWFPITYPWNLLDANEFFINNLKSKNRGIIEKGATVKGNVIIGKNTIVKSGSYIEGPVVIGDNCKIGPNCYLRQNTSIGSNCNIGNAVEIKNSIIGNNTCIAHLSYVGDSIVGENVNFGAGTKIANLRHDNLNVKSFVKGELVDTLRRKLGAILADGVHTGINTSINPGRKIWPNKTTLPGEVVNRDIQ